MRGNLYRRMFLEADDEVEMTETEMENEDTNDDEDDGSMSIDTINDDMDDDDQQEESSDDEPVSTSVSIGISRFGTDNSPEQNQYNPKEIETLNNLISSENSAIGEYFQASKETNVDVLRRLYSDIGEEERFHSEQLLFAKSQITGERYVPRDPDVKREYEELLSMGMDEETAMATAVDKVGLMPKEDTSPEETNQQLEFAIDQVEQIQESLYREYMMYNINCATKTFSTRERDRAINVYIEAYSNNLMNNAEDIFMEDVTNATEADKKDVKILNISFSGLLKLIKGIVGAIKRLAHSIAVWATNMRKRTGAKLAWLKRHKLSDLFKSGIHLYFYDEARGVFNYNDALKYMYRINMAVSKVAEGASTTFNLNAGSLTAHRTLGVSDDYTPGNLQEAIENIRRVSLSKTKVIINDNNAKMFTDLVFVPHDGNKSVYKIYEEILKDFNTSMDATNKFAEQFAKLQDDKESLYYRDREKYNELMRDIEYCVKGYQVFINALTSDMNELMKADKTFANATNVGANEQVEQQQTAAENQQNTSTATNTEQIPQQQEPPKKTKAEMKEEQRKKEEQQKQQQELERQKAEQQKKLEATSASLKKEFFSFNLQNEKKNSFKIWDNYSKSIKNKALSYIQLKDIANNAIKELRNRKVYLDTLINTSKQYQTESPDNYDAQKNQITQAIDHINTYLNEIEKNLEAFTNQLNKFKNIDSNTGYQWKNQYTKLIRNSNSKTNPEDLLTYYRMLATLKAYGIK